jgi:hypothetical protein
MSVCPSAWKYLASFGRIFIKVYICAFFENLLENIRFIKILQEQQIVYMEAYVHLR